LLHWVRNGYIKVTMEVAKQIISRRTAFIGKYRVYMYLDVAVTQRENVGF